MYKRQASKTGKSWLMFEDNTVFDSNNLFKSAGRVKILFVSCIIIGLNFFLFGCNATNGITIERISSQELILEEIEGMPTQFSLDIPSSKAAWVRAVLFVQEHTKGSAEIESNKIVSCSNHPENQFIYRINKHESEVGANFEITCEPIQPTPSNQAAALLNAKNLARFLRNGELELSLLKW